MKRIISVLIAVLLVGSNAWCEEEQTSDFGGSRDIKFAAAPDISICVSATDRQAFVEYLEENFPKYEPDSACIMEYSCQGDLDLRPYYRYEIKTIEDVPYSSVMLKDDGNLDVDKLWFIYYENNHGYMPVEIEAERGFYEEFNLSAD